MNETITAYEWSGTHRLRTVKRDIIEGLLIDIWQDRHSLYPATFQDDLTEEEDEVHRKNYQPFLKFDGETFKTRNYVGFVEVDDELIEIYPKVFKGRGAIDKQLMLEHLFLWFRYCRRFRLPFTNSRLDIHFCDSLPELLIFLFAHYCLETISAEPYSCYIRREEVLQVPKGRIDFRSYLQHGLAHGNFHEIDCIYEPFEFDNDLNRGIKHVCKRLLHHSKFFETQQVLTEIGFILDDVDEGLFTPSSLDRIVLSPMFSRYDPILEWCKRFLRQQLYSHQHQPLKQWTLLLPMEYVFEDFLAGFLESHFLGRYEVEYQKSDLYLSSNPQAFNIQHDILISNGSESLIVDAKYKLLDGISPVDPKRGVASSDMYQMVSYAYRRGCEKVLLLYPSDARKKPDTFHFEVEPVSGATQIQVWVAEVPFWNLAGTSVLEDQLQKRLEMVFDKLQFPCFTLAR